MQDLDELFGIEKPANVDYHAAGFATGYSTKRDPTNPAYRKLAECQARADEHERKRDEGMIGDGRPVATRYSTQYAIDWGRQQRWKLLDRENYDRIRKRHHDLWLAADALFESDSGLVLIQGAGRYERAEHRERFDAAGGETRAKRFGIRFFYIEFVRESKEPALLEQWN